MLPVILSGGAGTRLWPLSRELYPKQLLPLVGELTMLQETVARLDGLADIEAPLIVCNETHRFIVAEQLRLLGKDHSGIVLEPCARNTAPAVAVAALLAMQENDDPVLLILPADHVIQQTLEFQQKVEFGAQLAGQGKLVTFGIVPDSPETGYGYIHADHNSPMPLTSNFKDEAFSVDSFVEKPNLATAENYLSSGDYYWNSGMFMFRASIFLSEMKRFAPEILQACKHSVLMIEKDIDFLRLDKAFFSVCPSDSIDYAVMEKTEMAVVIPLNVGWSDVGSWSALWRVSEHDLNGNMLKGDVLTENVSGCYLHAGNRLLAAVGVQDLVVVETADAVLVSSKDQVQKVKDIVAQLKNQQRGEAVLHRKVNRPWGTYEGIDFGERFQVKRITVDPGASLSLQLHHHRAEHWIVVSGIAKVTCGDEVLTLSENQSTYIPLGEKHRLENPGKITLEMIEVQSGLYLEEDDIVRFEDDYGRE